MHIKFYYKNQQSVDISAVTNYWAVNNRCMETVANS